MHQLELEIDGMTCAGCGEHVAIECRVEVRLEEAIHVLIEQDS